MAILPLLIFITISFLSPADVAPWFARLHGMQILAGVAVAAAFLAGATKRAVFVPQVLAVPLFLVIVAMSRPLNGWIGGAALTFPFLNTAIPLVFCAYLAVTNLVALRVVAFTVAAIAAYITWQGFSATLHAVESTPYVLFQAIENGLILKRARGLGFLSDPNDLAQFLIVSATLLAFFWTTGRQARNFFVVLLPAAWLLWGAYLTHSRGSLLGIFVIILMTFRWRYPHLGPIAAAAAVGGLVLGGMGGARSISLSSGTAGGRIEIWSDCLQLIKGHLLFGVGFQNFAEFSSSGLTAHNSFLQCFVELGIFGFFLWVAILVMTSQQMTAIIKCPVAAPYHKSAKILLATLYAFLGPAFFISRTYAPPLYLIVGLGMALYAQATRHVKKPIPTPHWLKPTTIVMVSTPLVAYILVRFYWM